MISLVGLVSVRAQDEQAALDDLVSQYAEANGPALVVQVTTPDGTWTSAGGLADEKRPTETDDRFRIGSMSKLYVATVALMLADEGVFKLDDPSRTWLPQEIVDKIANVDTVTIRQLLSMRSGIDDYLATDGFNEAIMADPIHQWTAAEALTYAYDLPPLFAPDEAYSYSNTNFLLMQMILEKASGKPLYTLVRERILDPLKLKNTYTQVKEDTLPGAIVFGYEDIDGDSTIDEVSRINDGNGLGDGALVATTADVTAFYRVLLQDKTLLSPAAMKDLMTFQDDGEGDQYSLALAKWEMTGYGTAIGHSGAVSGFVSEGFYLPEYQTIVVVLSATADGVPDEIASAAVQAILGGGE